LPHDPRHAGDEPRGAGPDARRLAHVACRGHDPQHARADARMAARPAAREAGEPDAAGAPERCGDSQSGRLPRGAEIAVTVPAPARERVERLERIWVERPGVLGWLTTTDHKRIGLLYFWATLVFVGAGGVEALLLRTPLARANEHVLGPNMYDHPFTTHGLR